MAILNENDVDFTQQPMFGGEGLGLIRSDVVKYRRIAELTDRQIGQFWQPEEFDLTRDRLDYKDLEPHEKHIFDSNIKYQALLDSLQVVGIGELFGRYTSLPEVKEWTVAWSFSELIHDRSYTHILRNINNDPTPVLDEIIRTPQIISRARYITAGYDHMSLVMANPKSKPIDRAKAIVGAHCTANILEGILFYVSFACSYAFSKNGKMEGNTKTISSINRDEILHLAYTQYVMNLFRKGAEGSLMQDAYGEMEDQMRDMYALAVEQESAWADFLFMHGTILGLNANIAKQYTEYLAQRRMVAVGLKPFVDGKLENPIPWVSEFTQMAVTQQAPQEVDKMDYIGNAVDSSGLDTFQFKL